MDDENTPGQLNALELLPTKLTSIDVTKIAIREENLFVINCPTSSLEPYTHVKYNGNEAIMFPIRKDHCGIYLLSSESINDISQTKSPHILATSLNDCHKEWTSELENQLYGIHVEKFSMSDSLLMKSPKTSIVQNAPDFEDAQEFLDDRYYSVLYSFNIPLTYFPKTTLPRVRVLSQQHGVDLKSVLGRRLLKAIDLEQRHSHKFGCLQHASAGFDLEYSNKFRHLVSEAEAKAGVALDEVRHLEENLKKIVADLKFRETCLQLLLLLEILVAAEVDEGDFLASNAKILDREQRRQERMNRKRLIRSGTKRKIVPTFLGMGGESSLISSTLKFENNSTFEWFLSMNAHLDRLLLWDALDMAGGVTESRVFQYLAYVVVPYFKRSLPEIVNFMVHKFKAGTVKYPKHRSKPKLDRSGQPKHTLKQSVSKATNKYSSRVMQDRPTLAKSLHTDPFPTVPLKRTSSSFASSMSTQQLQKRQIDFSVKRLKSTLDTSLAKLPSTDRCSLRSITSFTRSSQGLFGERRKRTHDQPLTQQIKATPIKTISTKTASQVTQSSSSLLERLMDASEEQVNSSPIKVTSANLLPFKTPQKLETRQWGKYSPTDSPVVIASSPVAIMTPLPRTDSAIITETPNSKNGMSYEAAAAESPCKKGTAKLNIHSDAFVGIASPFYPINDDDVTYDDDD